MKYKFKSLNCNSCAAPLIKKMDSNICKCIYCRNTNLISENGKTEIIEDVIEAKPIPKKKYSTFIYIISLIACVSAPMLLLSLFNKYKNKEDENKEGKYKNGGAVLQKM